MKPGLKLVVGALAALGSGPALAAAKPVAGRWVTEDRSALVEIAPCGAALCGTIARFLTPPKNGPDPRDANNADPAKRGRRILGLSILTGLTAKGDRWEGRIYDPRSGKTYRSVLVARGDTLDVKGCVSVFCKTQSWSRAR